VKSYSNRPLKTQLHVLRERGGVGIEVRSHIGGVGISLQIAVISGD
jgi:hypothetical protein